eukprot:GFUD01036011.1.p1 GENE.GFUD01036011.1~~GFUD01036011.1.p1  ORF type:complete len:782 (+),score=288.73 GFUD01036011.1:56-2401(+)
MCSNSPSEPTQVISMLGAYQTQVRHSTSGSSLAGLANQSSKRSLATRLAFDDTLEESGTQSAHKLSRVGADPFSSQIGMRRFPSENTGTITTLHKENQELKAKVREMEAMVAGAKARAAGVESKLAKMELDIGREKVERDQEKDRLERGKREDREKIENLQAKLKQMKQRENDRLEEGSRSRRSSIDRAGELEMKVRNLREDKSKLEEQMAKVNLALSNRPELDKLAYRKEVQDYKTRISELENKEQVGKVDFGRMEEKSKEGERTMQELEKIKNELKMEKLRGDRFEGELDANREAVLQRKVMRDKLEKFNELEKENISLRSRNKLLVETAANSALLKEQVRQLEGEVTRMEGRVKDMDHVKAELGVVRKEVQDWGDVVREWMTAEERELLGGGEVGVVVAKEVVRDWQGREISYVDDINTLRNSEKELQKKLNGGEENRKKLDEEIRRVREEQGEQAKLVKKLQRKLLLVTKERDSYKGVLDSYEKEITMTGGQMDQERIMALEKNIEEYRAMVDMLEEEKGEIAPKAKEDAPNKELEEKVRILEEQNERLDAELERRSIKGDFNPADTKVIHFSNNPTAQAVEKRAAQMSELVTENTALKARVQLLEDGQTNDLTMMVGAKVEEGEGEQVQELKEQLEKADLKKQRLMEAFKKTSHDFREVVYHLTGYRIDVLSDHKYRLLPLYAESQDDSLLFQKSKSGEIQMLESEFSLELGELMEEHLEKNNSIPMFLAGLIMQLYYKQHGAEEEEDEAEGSDTGGEGSTNSEADEGEIIEIDDD